MKLSREMTAKVLELAGQTPARTDPYAELPMPPSTNNLFITCGKRRIKSPEYKAWLVKVVPMLRKLKRPAAFPCQVHVTIIGAVNLSRDGDNMLKPIGDACVVAGVLPDDCLRHVTGWHLTYKPGVGQPGVALVEVRSE